MFATGFHHSTARANQLQRCYAIQFAICPVAARTLSSYAPQARTGEDRAAGRSAIRWDAHLVACVDAAFAGVSWDAYQAARGHRWTLVHGDFHPANVMWRDGAMILIDFELVGVGSGAQDLGQFFRPPVT